MNYLHDIENQIRKGIVPCQHLMEHEEDYGNEKFLNEFPKYQGMFIEQIENCECIDLGTSVNLEEFKIIPDICKSPYSMIWVNWEHSGDSKEFKDAIYGAFVFEVTDEVIDDNHFIIWMFIKRKDNYGAWVHIGSVDFYPRQKGGAIRERGCIKSDYMMDKPKDFQVISFQYFVQHIMLGFSAINCTNVQLVNNKAPKFINSKRVKKGKLPLYEYHTLEIKQETSKSLNSLGGKHESPRLHLRRGHIREYATGLFTWVQACVVGNANKGVIDKDYRIAQ